MNVLFKGMKIFNPKMKDVEIEDKLVLLTSLFLII